MMQSRGTKAVGRLLALAVLSSVPLALIAQDAPKPAPAKTNHTYGDAPSRWDIFAGYSYLSPKATVTGLNSAGQPVPLRYTSDDQGAIFSVARYFNKYAGFQVETGQHDVWVNSPKSNNGISTYAAGPIFRFPTDTVTPFVHGLVGAAHVGGPNNPNGGPQHPYRWGPDLTAGGGMDFETPLFNHHLAIRLFQADYEYMHANWGSSATPGGG